MRSDPGSAATASRVVERQRISRDTAWGLVTVPTKGAKNATGSRVPRLTMSRGDQREWGYRTRWWKYKSCIQ